MGPVKADRKSWREIKQQKKKWKAERNEKKLEKLLKASMEESTKPCEQLSAIIVNDKTCSIAVPGSILDNAQSNELRAYVAGQIARAACIYKISEIIVFDDKGTVGMPKVDEFGNKISKKCCTQFARLLQYLECPQYLRKHFFPLHKDLQHAGLMNPLDSPHHLRQDEDCPFREGIVTNKQVKSGKGSYVNIGLLREALVSDVLTPGLRVTVRVKLSANPEAKKIRGEIVSPETPFRENNIYWGYSVRIAHSLSEVFTKCPYTGGYDLTLGTSERGQVIDNVKKKLLRNYKHALIVFGGVHGLEDAVENDVVEVDDPSLLFDYYLNVCPNQGSRTIRTEEAVLITLAELRKIMFKNVTHSEPE